MNDIFLTVTDTVITDRQFVLHRLSGDPTTWVENSEDGSDLSPILVTSDSLDVPYSLALDYVNSKVYYMDISSFTIKAMQFPSPSPSTVYSPTSPSVSY